MEFIELLRRELVNLPGEDAHLEMFPLRARSSEALKTAENYRLSAVMVLIFPEDNEHKIILIERQDYDGKHSGQISFPGGKKEESDESSLAAALREMHEETGISPLSVNVIGQLTDVYIPVSNFLVHPYVGMLESRPQFIADTREVKSILVVSVSEILDDARRITTSVNASKGIVLKNIPAFYLDNKIVWGATALMLNELRITMQRIMG